MITIRRGLDVPISGAPAQSIEDGPAIRSVAVIGFDYPGMKPTMQVKVGDQVKKGQVLFTDKKNPAVSYTAPAGGTVAAIHRGEKRVFQSLVIDVAANETSETFPSFAADELAKLPGDTVVSQLLASGLWTALRTRPYNKVPDPATHPHSIFVTAIDTNPLSADPAAVIADAPELFSQGLAVLTRLTEGKVFVCHAPGAALPVPQNNRIVQEGFAGPHPAGLVGTHIHFLDPVNEKKTVWHIGYQDVMAIGALFTTGQLRTDRVVALAGPVVDKPRLLRTRLGASLEELTAGQVQAGNNRIISGSVLSGRHARGPVAWLGRYHTQVSVIAEGVDRAFMGWFSPGINRFSAMGIYLSRFMKGKRFAMTSNTNGSPRAIVPIGAYEKVMPLDVLPTQLLRYLVVGDLELAQKLGALELDEEDLALCTFVCPGKYEYGPILRGVLTRIEQEG
ncbi:MAG: Na(+)-translocating NADH-quinone reductase subunit A [Gammaproteobacteria bacterium]|nr:MAG: Na(+)-translocating NADH-quinone reductase subunit A [Gammaproteobacteria bacterium]